MPGSEHLRRPTAGRPSPPRVGAVAAGIGLVGAQVAEQDPGLTLADVQTGQVVQLLAWKRRSPTATLSRSALGRRPGARATSSTAKPSSLSRRIVPSTR